MKNFWPIVALAIAAALSVNPLERAATSKEMSSQASRKCNNSLGMQSGKIKNKQLVSIDSFEEDYYDFAAKYARLNRTEFPQGFRGNINTKNRPWIKVTFDQETVVTGISTQGYGGQETDNWVLRYNIKIEISEGKSGSVVDKLGKLKLFRGNKDRNSIVYHAFDFPQSAKSVTIYFLEFHKRPGFRFELYGCVMEMSFELWIKLKNEAFHKHLFRMTSGKTKGLRKQVINKVKAMLRNKQGFSVEMRRFSPGSVIAELRIGTSKELKEELINATRTELLTTNSSMDIDSNYFVVREPEGNDECQTPNITLVGNISNVDSPTKIAKSKNFTLFVEVGNNCVTGNRLNLDWYMSKMTRDIFGNLTKIGKRDFPRLDVKERSLDYGVYFLKVEATTSNERIRNYAFGFFEIVASSLIAKISTGSNIFKGVNKTVTFDASGSFDPDVLPQTTEGMNFSWLCRRKDEPSPKNFSTVPLLVFDNNKRTGGGCYGNGPRRLNSVAAKARLDVTMLELGITYVVEVKVMKGNRHARAKHTFGVTTEDILNVEISCTEDNTRPCSSKVNPTQKTQLTAICKGLACAERLTYQWSVYELTPFSNRSRKLSLRDTILNRVSIIFQAGTLKQGKMYKVFISVHSKKLGISKRFSKQLESNVRPYGGRCFADRYSGEALKTSFKFNCTGWQDDPEDFPLTYEFGYKTHTGIVYVLQISEKSSAESKLALGDPSRNFSLQMIFRVKDRHGFYVELKFTVQVRQRTITNATQSLMQYAVGDDSDVGTLLDQGNVKEATQLASAVLSVLSTDSDNALKQQEKIKIKDSVIKHMARVNVTDNIETLIQVASVVAGVTENQEELSQDSQEKSVNVLQSMTTAFEEISKEKKTDKSNKMKAGNNLLHGIGNVLVCSSIRAKVTKRSLMLSKNKTEVIIKKKNKEMAKKAFQLISVVAGSLLSNRKSNEEPMQIETKALSLVLVRKTPSEVGNQTVHVRNSTVVLPPSSLLLNNLPKNSSFIDTQMVSININPFTWHPSAQVIKTPVISIDLKDDNGNVVNVSHLSKEIELKIPNPAPVKMEELYHFANTFGMAYHQFNISSEALTVQVKIVPEDSKELLIYLEHSIRPTSQSYSYKAIVPNFSTCDSRMAEGNYTSCSSDPFLLKFTSNITGHLGTHYLGIQLSTSNNDGPILSRRRRSPCSGNDRQKRSVICNEFKDPPTTPAPTPLVLTPTYNPATDINYTISISMGTCQYWDEQEERWSLEGCRVGPSSNLGSLQCLCTHLSSFGGDFFVAPNPIDFDKVFLEFTRLADTGNIVVLTTVFLILGVYIVAAVFARREDNKDQEKMTEVIPLGRFTQDGSHIIEITVYTGIWRKCGTTANVAINIHGEERDSGVTPLSCNAMCAKKLFQRGSIHTFVLPLAKDLGDLTHLKIWHDNSGKNPSWFLRQIIIRDTKKNTSWTFLSNRWLAVEKDDGKIERVLYVASDKEINGFRNKFFTRTANGLGDGHIWLSVMTRPPSSHFTRIQRLSCCLSVFMSAMVANAMFYNFGTESENTFQFGPLVMSWNQIIVGVQSSFIVVPVNLLIVAIFRNVKPKTNSHTEKQVYNVNEDVSTKDKKKGFTFPHWCLYIAWTLCLATSIVSASFTVFYSMMWGKETSNQWLTSVLVSFSQDIVVIQPIKVLLVACLLSLILKKAPQNENLSKTEYDGVTSTKVLGGYKPVKPKTEELKKFREYRVRVLAMARILLEVFFYLTFAWMLLVIVYGYRDTNRYYLTKNVEEVLPRFGKVKNFKTFWNWTESRMVPGLYQTVWYNGHQFEYKEGFVSNRKVYIVGMPRLRQLRVKEGVCPIKDRYPALNSEENPCQPQYSFFTEDTTPFNRPGWIPFDVNQTGFLSEFELYKICPRPWRYRDYRDLDNLPFQGVQALYGGGGYVADLGYTADAARRVMKNLRENNWIDTRTRAVFLEILLHEPTTKLFSAVTYLVEFLATGNAITYHKVISMPLYGAYASGFQSFYALCELLVILVVVYFILSECIKLYRLRCKYFKSMWTYVELAQINCALSTIVLSIFRRYHTSQLVSRVHENPFKTTSFHYVVLWSELETILIAVLVFVITIKLLKILKFNEHISTLASSMKNSFKNISSYSIVFLVTFFAFAQMAYLVFSSTVLAYSSLMETMRAQFSLFLGGPMNYQELKAANRILGPLFFFAFITSMAMVLINMFLAILNEGYHNVKLFPEQFSEDHKMVVFFKDYAKQRLRDALLDLKSFKLFPKSSKYEVRYHKVDSDGINYGHYKSLKRRNSNEFDEIPNTEEDEATFIKGLKESLSDIRNELQKFKITKRSKKYELQKRLNHDTSSRGVTKDFCVGLLYKPKLRLSSLRLDELLKGSADHDENEELLSAEISSSDEEVNNRTKSSCLQETFI